MKLAIRLLLAVLVASGCGLGADDQASDSEQVASELRPRCGDGRCSPRESCSTCAIDCGVCTTVDAGGSDTGTSPEPTLDAALPPVTGTWIQAASCERAAVQAAIASAIDGDRIAVPAGTCTWNEAVRVDKSVTLRGAGAVSGGTKILYGGTNHTLIVVDPGAKRGAVDVSGFWLYGGDPNYWGGTAMTLHGPDGWKNLRVHHMVFEENKQWTIKLGAQTHGVIDHNTFKGAAHGIVAYGRGDADWSTPLTLGTGDFFFIEDNVFDWNDWYGVTGAVAADMNSGGRVVFRNNTVRNGFFETHDAARSGLPSAHAYEVYSNTFATNTDKWKGIDISAGTGVIWGNAFTGPYAVPIGGMDYKSFDPRSLRLCDGTDPLDQNVPGESGWRCQYQIGSHGQGPTATGYPLYLWSNTVNASATTMRVTAGENHVRSGRDFIDTGSSAKPSYAPFTYPHPLVR